MTVVLRPESEYAVATTRRRLLFDMGLAVGGAGIALYACNATPAAAKPVKLAQGDIGYQARPNGAQRCDLCVNWQAPGSCKLVAGAISASGWCGLFVRQA